MLNLYVRYIRGHKIIVPDFCKWKFDYLVVIIRLSTAIIWIIFTTNKEEQVIYAIHHS